MMMKFLEEQLFFYIKKRSMKESMKQIKFGFSYIVKAVLETQI